MGFSRGMSHKSPFGKRGVGQLQDERDLESDSDSKRPCHTVVMHAINKASKFRGGLMASGQRCLVEV